MSLDSKILSLTQRLSKATQKEDDLGIFVYSIALAMEQIAEGMLPPDYYTQLSLLINPAYSKAIGEALLDLATSDNILPPMHTSTNSSTEGNSGDF